MQNGVDFSILPWNFRLMLCAIILKSLCHQLYFCIQTTPMFLILSIDHAKYNYSFQNLYRRFL